MSLYYLDPTYPHGPPIMYHLPQLFVPVFPEKCKQNYLPSSLYRGKLFSRPSLGQWREILSARYLHFCTLLISWELFSRISIWHFSREINCAESIVQLQIYFYPIVSSTMSSIIRHSMYTSPQETKITLVFFLVVHISILIWLLWKLKHHYQYDCTVRAWISCIITNHSNQSTLLRLLLAKPIWQI